MPLTIRWWWHQQESHLPNGHTITLRARPKKMRHPGIEPGASAWEAPMLPLHQWRMHDNFNPTTGIVGGGKRNFEPEN